MNVDELLEVIEEGLKDVRTQILKQRDPNAAARKARPVEERLNDLEHAVWSVKMELSGTRSTIALLQMNVARLQSLTTEASTKPSPETRRAKGPSRSRARRA